MFIESDFINHDREDDIRRTECRLPEKMMELSRSDQRMVSRKWKSGIRACKYVDAYCLKSEYVGLKSLRPHRQWLMMSP